MSTTKILTSQLRTVSFFTAKDTIHAISGKRIKNDKIPKLNHLLPVKLEAANRFFMGFAICRIPDSHYSTTIFDLQLSFCLFFSPSSIPGFHPLPYSFQKHFRLPLPCQWYFRLFHHLYGPFSLNTRFFRKKQPCLIQLSMLKCLEYHSCWHRRR